MARPAVDGLKGLADGASWADARTTITWVAIPEKGDPPSRSEVAVDQRRRCGEARRRSSDKAAGVERRDSRWCPSSAASSGG